MSEAPADGGTLVFERPVPKLVRALAILPFALMCTMPVLLFSGLLNRLEDMLPLLKDPAALPFGDPLLTLMLALIGLPALGCFATSMWVRRRFGRCELSASEAIFEIPCAPVHTGRVTVALSDVVGVQEFPLGLLVKTKEARWRAHLRPLLIFANEEEVGLALAHLGLDSPGST